MDADNAQQPSRQHELILGACLFVSLLVVNAIACRQTQQLHADAQLLVHTHQVIEALDDLLATVKDAETGQRGYLITGEDRYLQSYETAILATKEKISSIEQLIKNSPQEQQRIPDLQTALNLEVKELADTVAVRRQAGFDPSRLIELTDHEDRTMDALEGEMHDLQHYEEEQLESEEQASDNDYRGVVFATVGSAVLALATLAAFIWYWRQGAR